MKNVVSQPEAHKGLLIAAAKSGNVELWQTVVNEVSGHRERRRSGNPGVTPPCVCVSATIDRTCMDMHGCVSC